MSSVVLALHLLPLCRFSKITAFCVMGISSLGPWVHIGSKSGDMLTVTSALQPIAQWRLSATRDLTPLGKPFDNSAVQSKRVSQCSFTMFLMLCFDQLLLPRSFLVLLQDLIAHHPQDHAQFVHASTICISGSTLSSLMVFLMFSMMSYVVSAPLPLPFFLSPRERHFVVTDVCGKRGSVETKLHRLPPDSVLTTRSECLPSQLDNCVHELILIAVPLVFLTTSMICCC